MGEKIKKYLDEHGIKRTFLAEKSGISLSILNEIMLRGRRIECTEYYRICEALGLDMYYFFQQE